MCVCFMLYTFIRSYIEYLLYVYTYVCMYIYVNIYISVCIYIYIYIYIYMILKYVYTRVSHDTLVIIHQHSQSTPSHPTYPPTPPHLPVHLHDDNPDDDVAHGAKFPTWCDITLNAGKRRDEDMANVDAYKNQGFEECEKEISQRDDIHSLDDSMTHRLTKKCPKEGDTGRHLAITIIIYKHSLIGLMAKVPLEGSLSICY